jgi:hypothetical protein
MVGKIRGFLILCLACLGLGLAAAALAFVDMDRAWSSVRKWVSSSVPFLNGGAEQAAAPAWDEDVEMARLVADAAFEALKSGKAGTGDLYDLGQFYYKAKEDGKIDNAEFERMVDMAEQSGVMDAVIDKFLEPGAAPETPPKSPAHLKAQLDDLMRDVQEAQSHGALKGRQAVSLLNRVRTSGIPAQIVSMLPPGYDQTSVRQTSRDLAKAVMQGRVSMDQVNTLYTMFISAQADGRLNERELNQMNTAAERMVR